MSGDLRAQLEAFAARDVPPSVKAYFSDAGFQAHLLERWKGPELVVAIVEGKDDVRGSLVKRADAFAYAGAKDGFASTSRLVMFSDARGATFWVFDPT